MGEGFGRGKVILLGEHAVVYGHPALAAGIERGVRASAVRAERDEAHLSPWDQVVVPDATGDLPLERAFAVVLDAYEGRPPLRLDIAVELPAGAGLGCSAAIGVAVIEAIDQELGLFRTPNERGELALSWEKVFHGNPSGVDNMMSACGGLCVYRKGEALEPVPIRSPLTLVVGNSGEPSSTREMVESVARQHEKDPERIEKTFEGIASIVRNGRLACIEGDHKAIGQLMDLNHFLLSSLMLCTTKLDQLCQAARNAGAVGAKLTGAGGGGCMVALTPGPAEAAHVVSSLEPLCEEAFIAEVRA